MTKKTKIIIIAIVAALAIGGTIGGVVGYNAYQDKKAQEELETFLNAVAEQQTNTLNIYNERVNQALVPDLENSTDLDAMNNAVNNLNAITNDVNADTILSQEQKDGVNANVTNTVNTINARIQAVNEANAKAEAERQAQEQAKAGKKSTSASDASSNSSSNVSNSASNSGQRFNNADEIIAYVKSMGYPIGTQSWVDDTTVHGWYVYYQFAGERGINYGIESAHDSSSVSDKNPGRNWTLAWGDPIELYWYHDDYCGFHVVEVDGTVTFN